VRETDFDWLMFIGAQSASAFVRHATRVQACSKDFTAGPSVYVFLAGIGEVGRSEHHRTHLNDTDIAFFN
jgi:hypothetical protein